MKAAGTIAVVGLTLVAVAACTSSGSSGSSSSPGTTSDQPLKVVVLTLPQYLGDPYQAIGPPRTETMSAVFDTLTRVGTAGVIPWLATKWTRANATTWDFTLRRGVKFSDGETFNSSSVVASVKGLSDPANVAALSNNYLSGVAGATAVSPTEVSITTKAPDGVLPQQLAALNMIPPKYYAKVGATQFAQQPVGTGPYKVDSINTNVMQLSAFTGSWRKPKTPKITITAIADPSGRGNALQSGQADLDLEVDLSQVAGLRSSGFTVDDIKNEGVLALGFVNTAGSTPLSSPDVRLALNLAIDRNAIVKDLYQGLTSGASQGVTPGIVGYDPAVPAYPYDPTKAKQLLAQAGYPNGFSFSASITTGSFANDAEVFQAAQSDLAKVGVQLTLNQVSVTTIVGYLISGKYPTDVFSTAYQTSPEQDATKAYFTYSCLRANTIFCDPAAAKLISQAISESNPAKRTDLLDQLAVEAHNNPSAIYLVNGLYLAAADKKVHGFTEDQSTYVDWENITVG